MAQAHGARFWCFWTGGEDVRWISLPGCAVEDGLSVGSKPCRTDAATAECELSIKRRLEWWRGEEQFAGVQSEAGGNDQCEGRYQSQRQFFGGCPRQRNRYSRTRRPRCRVGFSRHGGA